MVAKFTAALAVAAWAALTAGAVADEPSTAEQIVNVMNKLWGAHPATRANHAKGVVFEGVFTPTPAGKTLSKAALFSAASVPVTVRYSNSTGVPNMPDGDLQRQSAWDGDQVPSRLGRRRGYCQQFAAVLPGWRPARTFATCCRRSSTAPPAPPIPTNSNSSSVRIPRPARRSAASTHRRASHARSTTASTPSCLSAATAPRPISGSRSPPRAARTT